MFTHIPLSLKKDDSSLLKLFLVIRLRKLLAEILLGDPNHVAYMEGCKMDAKIIPAIIKSIIESGDYTLEGSSLYTKIPQDILLDAACGNISQISVSFWSNLMNIYIQTRPEISQLLVEKLLDMKKQWGILLEGGK